MHLCIDLWIDLSFKIEVWVKRWLVFQDFMVLKWFLGHRIFLFCKRKNYHKKGVTISPYRGFISVYLGCSIGTFTFLNSSDPEWEDHHLSPWWSQRTNAVTRQGWSSAEPSPPQMPPSHLLERLSKKTSVKTIGERLYKYTIKFHVSPKSFYRSTKIIIKGIPENEEKVTLFTIKIRNENTSIYLAILLSGTGPTNIKKNSEQFGMQKEINLGLCKDNCIINPSRTNWQDTDSIHLKYAKLLHPGHRVILTLWSSWFK